MTSQTPLGPGASRVYSVHEATWWEELDDRERRLLDGALTVSVLTHPRRVLRVLAHRGEAGAVPETTGWAVARMTWDGASGPVALVTVSGAADADAPDDVEPLDLVVDLGGERPEFVQAKPLTPSPFHRAHFAARSRAPVAFDALRQRRTDQLERRPSRRDIPRTRSAPRSAAAAPPPGDKPRAVLFGLHWLELGGAERWALECIQAAAEAGFLPIVLTDRASSSPWVTRPELADAVFLPITSPLEAHQDATLLNGLFDAFDIRGIHLHHCTWLYERLPWIRARFPWVHIADSLHILEWRTGGFVEIAVRVTDAIDVHHVISPQLRDYLIQDMKVPREKVVLATLADLTPTTRAPALRRDGGTTVAFVGRLTQQKRPYLFLRLVARLRRDLPDARFVMHGDGELADEIRTMSRRLGLGSVLEMRGVDQPVSETLDDADVLVISSDNEGVTLTSFEAAAHDALVISADVGSQRSVVVDDLLCPRHPLPFLAAARERVITAVTDPEQRARWAAEQQRKVQAFAALPHAREWTRDLYKEWNA
ncbi:glycosyltransferase [Blastococcus sp. TF02A-30]|uniref:glycosyltransferase n=1 Tax=Blastococcus sp. TF02A-30 TaxID=2250580 RepID=UPI000DE8BA3A|nr:glycosyltransferase [Blastococcus sp. TF02A-30]RBY86574.1 glycosyl transferase [Blastococcus sp. TF02A-30]